MPVPVSCDQAEQWNPLITLGILELRFGLPHSADRIHFNC